MAQVPRNRSRAVIGAGLAYAVGIAQGIVRAHHDLGRNWQPIVGTSSEQTLVTNGIYRWVRHPMYTSQLLLGLGQALVLQNWVAGTGGLALFLALYRRRVGREERFMERTFGQRYAEYAARTGRLWPRVKRGEPRAGARSAAGR